MDMHMAHQDKFSDIYEIDRRVQLYRKVLNDVGHNASDADSHAQAFRRGLMMEFEVRVMREREREEANAEKHRKLAHEHKEEQALIHSQPEDVVMVNAEPAPAQDPRFRQSNTSHVDIRW